jgi:biopolymer transport protein ExbD
MAFQMRKDEDEFAESHEINVTPFIDVMLVLLIIFMVAAPLSTVNVPLELPVSTAKPEAPPTTPVVLSVQADKSWSIGDTPVSRTGLAAALNAETKHDHQTRIFVRADKKVSYEDLMEAMNALRTEGYLKVSLVGLDGGEGPR